jgi:hypothetical protein
VTLKGPSKSSKATGTSEIVILYAPVSVAVAVSPFGTKANDVGPSGGIKLKATELAFLKEIFDSDI